MANLKTLVVVKVQKDEGKISYKEIPVVENGKNIVGAVTQRQAKFLLEKNPFEYPEYLSGRTTGRYALREVLEEMNVKLEEYTPPELVVKTSNRQLNKAELLERRMNELAQMNEELLKKVEELSKPKTTRKPAAKKVTAKE